MILHTFSLVYTVSNLMTFTGIALYYFSFVMRPPKNFPGSEFLGLCAVVTVIQMLLYTSR